MKAVRMKRTKAKNRVVAAGMKMKTKKRWQGMQKMRWNRNGRWRRL
jgi:hypothetical protein